MLTVLFLTTVCLFSIGSNAVAQNVPVKSCSHEPTDIIFLVDDSDSLKDDDFKKELLFVNHIISFFDLSRTLYQVGVSTFSSDVHTYLKLGSTNDKSQIYSTVGNISPTRGMTYLGKALEHVITEGFTGTAGSRSDARKVLIIVTDGDTVDLKKTITASQILKGLKVTIFVIGIGQHLNPANLQQIVTGPENLFQTKDFDELPKIVDSLKTVVCKEVTNCKTSPADIIFALDSSDSVTGTDFTDMLAFVKKFVQDSNISKDVIRIGLFTFADKAQIQISLTSFYDKPNLLKAVDNIKRYHGMTNTHLVLEAVVAYWFQFLPPESRSDAARKILVVITDGVSIHPDATAAAAQHLRSIGVDVFTVGIGKSLSYPELLEMAGKKENVFSISRFDALAKIEKSVFKVVCESKKQPTCSNKMVDIVFLVDASDSITPTDFQDQLSFVSQFIAAENVGPNHVQVSVVSFAGFVKLEIPFTMYSDKASLMAAVGRIKQYGGSTNTAKALHFTQEKSFSGLDRTRSGARKIVALMTDGRSDDLFKAEVAAQKLRSDGFTIFSIAIDFGNVFELTKLAGSHDNIIALRDFTAFYNAFNKMSTC